MITCGLTSSQRKHDVRIVYVRPERLPLLVCNLNGVIVSDCAIEVSLLRRAMMELLEVLGCR